MNRERLIQLARVVHDAPEHKFHMRAFTERTACGTAHCAAGWAAVDHWFKAQGFSAEWSTSDTGKRYITEEKLGSFFGISTIAAKRLFALDISRFADPHAVSKAEVLANIEAILAGKEPEEYAALSEDAQ